MNRANVRAVLKALSSDQAIDWRAAESGAADSESQEILRELEVIARISAVHRGPESGEAGESRVLTFSRNGVTTFASERRWGTLLLKGRLGGGADGDVHRAFDDRLQREVALKMLRQTQHAAGLTRFLNEARLLARVRHANVVTVHGADVIMGQAGIWMELIDGRTLHELISNEGPLAAHEASLIGAEICRGLAAIHQAGILHRDIKAHNVMRETGGRIVLMDFSVSAADSQKANLAGTPLYLAPELLRGQAPSIRADIYSVGVLLYYLVTGAYPIAGTSVADIARAHEDKRRTRLRDARADLPAAFVEAVDLSLSADPAARPASAGELEDILMQSLPRQSTSRDVAPASAGRWPRPWLFAAAALMAVALTGAIIATRPGTFARHPAAVAPGARPWILIAAFENRTSNRGLDGVIEYALERELVRSPQLRVASRPRVDDALRLMRRPVDTIVDRANAREVALRDGEVRSWVEGRVETIGTLTVLRASVMDVHTGAAVASVSEEMASVDELPHAIRRLADQLRELLGEAASTIRSSSRQLERVTTPSLKALRLYSESYAAGERDHWGAAMGLAQQAIEEDPSFAAAHTWLAWMMLRNRLAKTTFLPEAAKGVELSSTSSEWERLWINASYHDLNGDTEQALSGYESLVNLYPDHYWGVNNLIGLYQRLGRDAEAVGFALRLAELRPHDYDALYVALDQLQRTGNLEQGKAYARRIRETGALDQNPSGDAWIYDAFVAWHHSDARLAVSELRTAESAAMSLDRELRDAILRRSAMLWLALGRPTDARNAVALVLPDRESHFILATISEATGDLSSAQREALDAHIVDVPGGTPTFGDLNQWAMKMWLLSRSGSVEESAALLASAGTRARNSGSRTGAAIFAVLSAEEAAARGASTETVRLLRDLRWDDVGPRTMFQAREALAGALVHGGNPDAAVDVLRPVMTMKHLAAYDRAIWWTHCQLLLAETYAHIGRLGDAQDIARGLDGMFSEAEPGFPPADRVRSLLAQAR